MLSQTHCISNFYTNMAVLRKMLISCFWQHFSFQEHNNKEKLSKYTADLHIVFGNEENIASNSTCIENEVVLLNILN